MGCRFIECLGTNPVIAAVNELNKLDKAIRSKSKIVFFLIGNIFNLKEMINKVKESGKLVFVHFDLMEGFSKDTMGLKYIIKEIKPDGIISTKSHVVKYSKEKDMFTIQRIFLLDSLNLESGINSIKSNDSDAVEILPGIIPRAVEIVVKKTQKPVITGGLIREKEDITNSLKAGAVGISTSRVELWNL